MRWRRWSMGGALVAFVIACLVLAGCGSATTGGVTTGGQTTGAGTETTAGSTSATGASAGGDGESIPIGILTSYTGELGAFGVMWFNAAKMAVDDINAAGGPLGKQIDLKTEDDRTNVEEGMKGARKLMGTQGVIALHGMTSDVLLAVWPIAREQHVMCSSPAAGTTRMDKAEGGYFFRTTSSDSFSGKVAARLLWDSGFSEIVMLYEKDEGRVSVARVVKEEFVKLGGKILADVPFTPRQPTYSAELQKVAAVNPKAVYLGVGQESGPVLLKEAHLRGYKWQWIGDSDFAVPEMFDLVGSDLLEGAWSMISTGGSDSPEYEGWAKRYEQLFNQEPTGGYQTNSYDAMVIYALAIEKAGKATGEAINDNFRDVTNPPGEKVYNFADGVAALRAGKDINYEGLSGSCDMDEYGNTSANYVQEIAKSGKWVEGRFFSQAELADQ